MLYQRTHSRLITDYSGFAQVMPYMAFMATFFALANSAFPGTSGFVGEFLIILGSYQLQPIIAIIATISLVTGASYNLLFIKNIFYGPIDSKKAIGIYDCTAIERLILTVLAFLVLLLGICPSILISSLDPISNKIFHTLRITV
jgi:NADH-quinone oxidoreductase subunit M